ncbi:MAG TPA: adenosylcobinamide-GDP ribazoletransferase [Chloroflexota bacterium]
MPAWRGFVGALQFLTRFPLPATENGLGEALGWLPLVGLLMGAVLGLVELGMQWLSLSPLLASTVIVVLLLAISGALHADGLMDTCDAVFGHASPERRLEIMRDPRTGAFGVAGLVSIVALKIAALASLPWPARLGFIVLAPCLGRWSIVLVTVLFPYGRPTGLGAPLKAAASPKILALASVVPVVACAVVGPPGLAAGLIALVVAVGIGRWLMTLLPGLTGDCYGATCEVVETVVWLSGALLLPRFT